VVVGSRALDPESLSIVSGRLAWRVAVEASVVVDEGNVIDCLLNGVVLALLDVRKPLVKLQATEVTLEEKQLQPLSLAHLPLSLTFGLTPNNIFADPSAA
jgi:exosome complex RNA-binding protein Rrp42 (RNase PH superfamily)